MKPYALLLIASLSLTCAAAGQTHDAIVRDFFNSQSVTMHKGATAADVDKYLAFYVDDVVYEDPAVKIRIEGKERIRSGVLSHLDDYVGSASETRISLDRSISLANAVAAVVTEVFWVNGASGREKIQRQRLKIIEFRGEKISRVIDYH